MCNARSLRHSCSILESFARIFVNLYNMNLMFHASGEAYNPVYSVCYIFSHFYGGSLDYNHIGDSYNLHTTTFVRIGGEGARRFRRNAWVKNAESTGLTVSISHRQPNYG